MVNEILALASLYWQRPVIGGWNEPAAPAFLVAMAAAPAAVTLVRSVLGWPGAPAEEGKTGAGTGGNAAGNLRGNRQPTFQAPLQAISMNCGRCRVLPPGNLRVLWPVITNRKASARMKRLFALAAGCMLLAGCAGSSSPGYSKSVVTINPAGSPTSAAHTSAPAGADRFRRNAGPVAGRA